MDEQCLDRCGRMMLEDFAGKRVRIDTPYLSSRYRGKFNNKYGTIERISSGRVGVKVDGEENDNSSYGVYWFEKYDLYLIKEENKEMASAITGNYKVAVVKYIDGYNTEKEYNFALFPEDVSESEHYLVKDTNGYHVVKLIRTVEKDEATHPVTQEIVCGVNFTNYNQRIEDRATKKKIKAKMDAMLKEDKEMLLYQAMAEKNPAMAELLTEYRKLGNI